MKSNKKLSTFKLEVSNMLRILFKSYIFLNIVILSAIFLVVIPFGMILGVDESSIKGIIGIYIQIIGGIIGITFSIFLVYIQNLSNNFSGSVYYIITKRKEPLISFSLFIVIEAILLFLYLSSGNSYINLGRIVSIQIININIISFFSTIAFLFSLYCLWDLYRWSLNNLPPIKISTFVHEESKKILNSLAKKIETTGKQNKPKLLLFGINSERGLLYLYNSVLSGYIKILENSLFFDAKQIIEIFFIMLDDILVRYKSIFYIHPDFNTPLAINSTFSNFFVSLLIKVNRSTSTYVLPAKDYDLLNTILRGYEKIILSSLKIEYSQQDGMPKDESPILSMILGQFTNLGVRVVESKEDEGVYTWLLISQTIGPEILKKDYYINSINFLEGLEKIKINNSELTGVVLQEYIKVYSNLLKTVIINGEEMNYLYAEFEQILRGVQFTFHFSFTQKDSIYIDLQLLEIMGLIRRINLKFLSGELDDFIDEKIMKFIESFTKDLEFLKKSNLLIKNSTFFKYFCDFLLNIVKDGLENETRGNFYRIYTCLKNISNTLISLEKESISIFEYQIKILCLIIKNNLDNYELYLEEIESFIKKLEDLSAIREIYLNLSLVLVLAKKEGKEISKLEENINNYEKKYNEQILSSYSGEKKDVQNFLFPIKNYLLKQANSYIKKRLDDGIDEWVLNDWIINNGNLQKEDFCKYLGTLNPTH